MSILYVVILLFITLSGFGQMPIFKRYYIADIPGLGWLAQFYVTHALHYILAAVLTCLCVYAALDYLLDRSGRTGLTRPAYVKIASLAGLVVTGCLMMVKNLSGVYFPHGLIIGLDLLHLSFCMILLGAGAWTLIRRTGWKA